jgi:hypothetical protein
MRSIYIVYKFHPPQLTDSQKTTILAMERPEFEAMLKDMDRADSKDWWHGPMQTVCAMGFLCLLGAVLSGWWTKPLAAGFLAILIGAYYDLETWRSQRAMFAERRDWYRILWY